MGIAQMISYESIAQFHKTILLIIIVVALLTAGAKTWALIRCKHDGEEGWRVFAIIICLFAAFINFGRFEDRINYDPVALAQGSIYIIGLFLVLMHRAIVDARRQKVSDRA